MFEKGLKSNKLDKVVAIADVKIKELSSCLLDDFEIAAIDSYEGMVECRLTLGVVEL